jgi:hypothetical protein
MYLLFIEYSLNIGITHLYENRNAYRILVRKPEGKRHKEDQDVGRWTILK